MINKEAFQDMLPGIRTEADIEFIMRSLLGTGFTTHQIHAGMINAALEMKHEKNAVRDPYDSADKYFELILHKIGDKVKTIKYFRSIYGCSLKEAQDMLLPEKFPMEVQITFHMKMIGKSIFIVKQDLEEIGAIVELRPIEYPPV